MLRLRDRRWPSSSNLKYHYNKSMLETAADLQEAPVIPRKVWTREEAHALVDLGFPNAEKLELIEGELIDRRGKKHAHVLWQTLVHEWLRSTFGFEQVTFEAPADVAMEDNEHSEPEPDLKVLSRSMREFNGNPGPADILLVVEIADSSLYLDLHVKAKLYARAGIVEYWVVNIPDKRLIVHREPANGQYVDVTSYASQDEVSPLAAPAAIFSLDRL